MKKFYTNVAQHRGRILYRGVVLSDEGKLIERTRTRINYKPTVFIPTNKPTGWTTVFGDHVKPHRPGSMWDTKQYIESRQDIEGFEVYGNLKHEYSYLFDEFGSDVDFNMDFILIANIDIEVGSENGFPDQKKAEEEVTAISIDFNSKKTIVLGQDKYKTMPDGYKTDDPEVTYIECENEIDLLERFIHIWCTNYPDIVTGWNIKNFDMVYLFNRITKLFGEDYAKMLSPWGEVYEREFRNDFDQVDINIVIVGIAQIDYLEAYKKFAPKGKSQESYTLDNIGNSELGMSKLDYSEVENLHSLYKTNFQKYIDYNIRDTRIVRGLEEKLKLIELIITLAYDSLTNYEDVFRQVRLWDIIITNWLMKDNIVVPPMKTRVKKAPYKGAYVKEPKIGMHHYVASFDLDSLYPHLIMQYNISPETFVPPVNYDDKMRKFLADHTGDDLVEKLVKKELDLEWTKEYKVNLTPNGQFFTTGEEGFLAEIMRTLYDDRKKFKNMMIDEKKKLELIKQEKARRGI